MAAGFAALFVAGANAVHGANGPIDFKRDIEPILRTHCLECHGPRDQSAGLRLDSRANAQAGGASGLPILGGTLETNELWRRVSAGDDDFRMPRFADPLPEADLDRLRRWIEQGTPWPAPAREPREAAARSVWGIVYDRGISPMMPWLLAIGMAALLLERLKLHPPRRSPRLARVVTRISFVHAALVASILVGVNQFLETARLQAQYDALSEPASTQHFGDPPIPRRPDHARRLRGTYYRGNCERSDRLYNGGNYRTCSLHIALVDDQGKPLDYGDEIPTGGFFARFEIERAQNTTEQLFTPAIMDAIFLSDEVLPSGASPTPGRFTPIEEVETKWRWAASWPIPAPADLDAEVSGLIYVYRGAVPGKGDATVPMHTLPHYAISYHVRLSGGRIDTLSEVWLGALYTNERVASPPEAGKVPFDSWFSHLPLPEIEGEPSHDPKLLGLEEHLGYTHE